jgi:plastocyanin
MRNTISTRPFLRPTVLGASLVGIVLALAACSGSSPSPSAAGASQAAGGSQAAARCEATPNASPAATDTITGTNFGDAITIQAGQAVAFKNNDGFGHTVTEGTDGTAAANACVDSQVGAGGTVIVTFNVAGDYDITCKIHSSMHNVIHVQ